MYTTQPRPSIVDPYSLLSRSLCAPSVVVTDNLKCARALSFICGTHTNIVPTINK